MVKQPSEKCTCFYCNQEQKNVFALRAHLRFCPVRRNGIKYMVGDRAFLVKPKSYRQLGIIQSFLARINAENSVYSLIERPAVFYGFLLGLLTADKIKAVELPETALPPGPAIQPQVPASPS